MSGPLGNDPAFRWLWAAHTVSVFGSLVTRTALPFTAILALDASPIDMALLSVADLMAGLVTSLAIAPWLDRLRRRPLMLAADLGRVLALGSVPLAAALGLLRLELLYAVAVVAGVLDALFELAQTAYVPALVRREALVAANSRLSGSASVAEVAAFGLGGWLVQWLGPANAITVDAATFLVSAACLIRIAHREPPVRGPILSASWREAWRGIEALAHDPVLRSVALADAAGSFALRAFSAVFLLFVTRELGFTPGVLGLVFATGGVASLAGALAAPAAGRRVGPTRAIALGLAVTGGALLAVALAPGATLAGAALLLAQQVVGDAAYTVANVHEVSLRQSRVAPAVLGRANAAKRLLDTAAMLAGALAGGAVGEAFGLRWALVLAGVTPLLAALGLARAMRDRAGGG
jgi:predicted MFS family arabinose efflux permease